MVARWGGVSIGQPALREEECQCSMTPLGGELDTEMPSCSWCGQCSGEHATYVATLQFGDPDEPGSGKRHTTTATAVSVGKRESSPDHGHGSGFQRAGDAATAIAGIPSIESCYKDAIGYCNATRFGEKTRLEQEYFARLWMLSPIRLSNNKKALLKLHNQVLVNIRGLKTPGVQKSSFSSMLCDILLRTLARDIVVQYQRSCAMRARDTGGDAVSSRLDGLLTFLSIKLERLENSNFWQHDIHAYLLLTFHRLASRTFPCRVSACVCDDARLRSQSGGLPLEWWWWDQQICPAP
ncbi:hypothetical protein HPB50_002204 [Hyalomma asiaticum]|uniref:Uncharacterized protein n=1 Tax=Hyalomma asiaticum TaxID=266040 RepID=A0ACB7RTQ5_HYAAI|nr:hypothetical protein HPB50_002204 [Hyalomma asiaticum]